MTRYTSQDKTVHSPVSAIYARLSDLSNLEALRARLDDPAVQAQLAAHADSEQQQRAREALAKMQFTPDTLTADVPPVGAVTLAIVERQADKCVKYQTTTSPVPVTLWVQMLPAADGTSRMRVSADIDLNPFLKMMVGKKLEQGIDRLADILSAIPY